MLHQTQKICSCILAIIAVENVENTCEMQGETQLNSMKCRLHSEPKLGPAYRYVCTYT